MTELNKEEVLKYINSIKDLKGKVTYDQLVEFNEGIDNCEKLIELYQKKHNEILYLKELSESLHVEMINKQKIDTSILDIIVEFLKVKFKDSNTSKIDKEQLDKLIKEQADIMKGFKERGRIISDLKISIDNKPVQEILKDLGLEEINKFLSNEDSQDYGSIISKIDGILSKNLEPEKGYHGVVHPENQPLGGRKTQNKHIKKRNTKKNK